MLRNGYGSGSFGLKTLRAGGVAARRTAAYPNGGNGQYGGEWNLLF